MSGGPALEELPERVRLRILSLVADALPVITPLPPTLRKVSAFAPPRRARLGGAAITAALADDDFRRHAATQVAASPVVPDDPVDTAGRAWLGRPDGWEETVADTVLRLQEPDARPGHEDEQVEKLSAQVALLQDDLHARRVEHKARLDEAKAENSTLRRRLGETRQALRAAEQGLAAAEAARDDAVRSAEVAVRAAEAESRRLRLQLEGASAELASSRQGTKSDKDSATLRARLLLDTLVDAASGLRRELGIPSVEGAPGSAIEAELAGQHAIRSTSAPSGPAALEQVLMLPHSRLLIDGYNVTKTAWESATLESQRSRLVAALAPLVARTGAETTVVFDAASSTNRPVLPTPRGVKVVYSPPGVIADDVIRRLVAAEPTGRVVVVVTNDQELASSVRREGARTVGSESLVALVSS